MLYSVELDPRAGRDLRKLPSARRVQIIERIERLQHNPRPPGVKKLSGDDSLWRIRVGAYRVIYQVQDRKLLVVVVHIMPRKLNYKR